MKEKVIHQRKKIENYKDSQLIFCSFSPVGLDDYVIYFAKNFRDFIYLKWKFPHSKGDSEIQYFKNGHLEKDNRLYYLPLMKNRFLYFLLLPVNYIIYFFQIFKIPGRVGSKQRIFFGINYFCTFCGIILKKIGRVGYVIYRVMDFFPIPKKGPYRILNRIFFIIDNFCLKNADSIWFTTLGHIEGRERYGYFDRNKANYQIIPLGLDIEKFISKPITKDNAHSLVYCGVVSRYHLLDMLFEVINDLKKEFHDIKLNLIGSGPDISYYKDLSIKMGLRDNIVFHGYMDEDEKFRNLISDNSLGIAFYKDEEDFMKYTEPAKVKYYLNFGVPAVISDVPKIARELDEKKVSIAVNNTKVDIESKIKNFMLNQTMQEEYKDNIKGYINSVDVKKLLDNTFTRTFYGKE